jgi:hypothetical protein
MFLNESLKVGLEILRWRECDKQNAEQLPTFEFTLSDSWKSITEHGKIGSDVLVGITGQLFHHLAIYLISELTMSEAFH